jgi:hypothetical protein
MTHLQHLVGAEAEQTHVANTLNLVRCAIKVVGEAVQKALAIGKREIRNLFLRHAAHLPPGAFPSGVACLRSLAKISIELPSP